MVLLLVSEVLILISDILESVTSTTIFIFGFKYSKVPFNTSDNFSMIFKSF